MNMEELMQRARAEDASDLILVAGKAPCVYVYGELKVLDDTKMTPQALEQILNEFMTEAQRRRLNEECDVNYSHSLPGLGRARVNIHKQRGSYAAAVRFINTKAPSFEDLNLPLKLRELAQLARGLVLVTGCTGSGKSTTLAAIIEYINGHYHKHIITLEDPIEFLFAHDRCLIEQREIGEDSPSFGMALRNVVRQKPDVILVGEMRDRETIATALTAAETGHLVLGTLHTNSAAETVERVIDVFDAAHQPQIRIQLAGTLRAVICQSLLTCADQRGMVPAVEMLLMTPAVRRTIRDGETHLIPGMIETGHKFGMQTMDRTLADLVRSRVVTFEAALAKSSDPEKFERLFGNLHHQSKGLNVDLAACAAEPAIKPGNAVSAKPWH